MTEAADACAAVSKESPEVVQGDISSVETAMRICGRAVERFGTIHTLVNNAGTAVDDLLATLSDEDLESMVFTNVIGLTRLTRGVLRPMMKQRSGCIVNVSSVLAQHPGRGNAVYAGTKGFVESFTRALAAELGRKQIRVNAVAPGVVETEMSRGVLAVGRESVLSRIAMRRLGTPEDVAALVSFLASDQAGYINGAVIPVDGSMGGW